MTQSLLTFLTIFGCIASQLVFGQMSGGGGGGEGGSGSGSGGEGSSGEDSSSGGEGGSGSGSGSGSGGGSSSSTYECNYMIAYGSDGVSYPYGIDVCFSEYSSGAYTSYMFTCNSDGTTITASSYSGASCSGSTTSSSGSVDVGSTYGTLTVEEIECNATDYDPDNCVIKIETAILTTATENCTDTTTTATTTTYYVEDICITEGNGTVSYQYECNDDTVNVYSYFDSMTCGGKSSADENERLTSSVCSDDGDEIYTYSCVDEDTSTTGSGDSGAYSNYDVNMAIACVVLVLSVLLN